MENRDEIGRVKIHFLAPFGGKDNWEIEISIHRGDTVRDIFQRLPQPLYEEIYRKVLQPEHARYGVALNGTMIPPEELSTRPLRGGEKISLLARLVGG
jgi:hypothetical protein